jgi:tRNA uridine 5-carbamoylmethylation protein Kti12
MLIVLSGLPGVGKTTIARELASSLKAVYLRIDSIEQALRDYRAWNRPRLVIDTARQTVTENVKNVRSEGILDRFQPARLVVEAAQIVRPDAGLFATGPPTRHCARR